ncbi:DsbA family protein [Guyparkeria sp. GHLCS8-2]|uniref:DsbA family oxidoreductase n=1 Tax=Guyparkeria halopsychrophila TaxID=3139421 RepID=UPI0037C55F65
MSNKLHVEYFSDLLCIWAYGAQIRLDQLHRDFPDEVTITPRYIPLFASTDERIGQGWRDRGGFTGFGAHIRDVASEWEHVEVHPDIWSEDAPASSTSPHLLLKAVQLLEDDGTLPVNAHDASPSARLAWALRKAFFAENRNIARREVQLSIAESMDLPTAAIDEKLDCGRSHAALHDDMEAQQRYQVTGSPTLVLNEGRQRLYGNVGYRIIEANIRELLHNPQSGEASWC